ELVPHPERATHHLQARLHLIAQFEHKASEPVPVSSDAALAGDLAAEVERAPLRRPIRPIDSDILHHGPPSRWVRSPESVSGEEALLHDIPQMLHPRGDLSEEVVALLVEHDLRLGDLADHPCEVASAPTAVDAVQAVDAGALEECVRRL